MWPMKLDMTREECRGVLRRLELESYGTVISTFRAQGCLSKEKLRMLEDLRRMLHISNDRHRAEARRVANDERLTTVAEIISGPNSGQDWRREGHRSFPILPRTVPHTALTYIANTVFEQLTRANAKLPHPADTSCSRLKKAEEMFRFELVRNESALFEKGFVRDAAVVTSDPLQDIMSKSYVKREEKRNEVSKSVEKPALECETDAATISNGEKTTTTSGSVSDQPSLCDILLNTNIRPDDHSQSKLNKSGERLPRKKPQATKRTWKSKSSFPPAKLFKHTLAKNGKQSSRANSLHSPHLIHSYAVPFDAKDTTANGGSGPELLQLQQHLTSNLSQQNQQNNAGAPMGQMAKSQQYPVAAGFPAPEGFTPSPMYNHQQGILPSSKKDIQYNLFKLKPNIGLGSKGNVNVPMKGIGFYSHGKSFPHALLNYQKKSPSKNILIPTSTAAVTLASLGLPTPLHPPLTDHSNNWVSSKIRDTNTKPAKHVKTNTPTPVDNATERSNVPSGDKLTAPNAELPCNTARPTMPTETITESTDQMTDKNPVPKTVPISNHATQSPITNNATPLPTQPSLAGFTAVKSGAKLSVHKMQLIPVTGVTQNTPLTPTAQKNNVFILPKSSAVAGVLNLGQKITIPKSIVDSSAIVPPVSSPPKVIVQSVPNPYSVTTTTFDMNMYRQNTQPAPKLRTSDEKLSGTVSIAATKELTEKSAVEQTTLQNVANAQKRPSSVTIPGDGVPGRKIKISTSQLVPFKGTLHATSMSPANIPCITIGAKKLRIDSDTSITDATVSSSLAVSNETDWENELDRTNSTQTPGEHVTVETDSKVIHHDSTVNEQLDPSAIASTTLLYKYGNKLSIDEETHRNDNGGNALHSTLSPSAGTSDRMGEYDIVSTERGDDSSVTDSADAEDDIEDEESQTEECEGIEEDDFGDDTVDVEMETEPIIIEEEPANYDHLIEEVPEDEQFVEEVEDGPMEFISVGYGTTHELVAELESTTTQQIIEEQCPENGMVQEEISPVMNYAQSTGGFRLVENGDLQTFVSHGMVCDRLEINSDGKLHARPYSSVSEPVRQTQPTLRFS